MDWDKKFPLFVLYDRLKVILPGTILDFDAVQKVVVLGGVCCTSADIFLCVVWCQ